MCWGCVELDGGHMVEITDEMKEVAGIIWDWYRIEGNSLGGALHVQLDDSNVDDWLLQDDWYDRRDKSYYNYSPEEKSLGDKIVKRLRDMPIAQRARTVYEAHPYNSLRPYS